MRRLLVFTIVFGACSGDSDPGASADRSAAAAARLASCSLQSPVGVAALSLQYFDASHLRCIVDADGCAEVLACVGLRPGAGDCPSPNVCVDGDTLLQCRGGLPFEVDCADSPSSSGPSCITP